MRTSIKPQIDVVSVTNTSKTLATLLGAALNSSTKKVTLVPVATGIYMDDGTASTSSHPMGTSSYQIDGGLAELSALEFYSASSTSMTVIQEG